MAYKTVRRDKVMRDVMKGLYQAKCDFRLTDDYAFDNATGFGKSEYKDAVVADRNGQQDVCPLPEYYFKMASCWMNEDGTVCLNVHSNLSYTLKKKEA